VVENSLPGWRLRRLADVAGRDGGVWRAERAGAGLCTLWVPETRPGILIRRFARCDRIRRDAARPL
jgi:hypothetical protein